MILSALCDSHVNIIYNVLSAGSSLQNYVEVEALEKVTADLITAVSQPDFFGSQLVQNELCTQIQSWDIVHVLGVSDSQKISKLLHIVNCKIKTASSKKTARDYFNKFVCILYHNLGLQDLAERLAQTCRKSIFPKA